MRPMFFTSWTTRRIQKPAVGHVLTGPIYVEGAEPGDTLEVRIVNIKARVPWAITHRAPEPCRISQPGYPQADPHSRRRGLVRPRHEISAEAVQGVMAVAPADDHYVSPIPKRRASGYAGSRAPGQWAATWI